MAKYIDYKLTVDGDREIENGDFVTVEDEFVIQQQVETNIKQSKRDWFLNLDEGIRYFNSETLEDGIFGAKIITAEQEGQIQAAVENTLGIIALNVFELNLTTDTLFVEIEALTEFGEVAQTVTIEI